MNLGCKECGRDLNVDPVEKPATDWLKVVCSGCGVMNNVSMVRLFAAKKQRQNR